MSQLFGYNTLKVDNKSTFLAHLRRLQPKATLFYADQLEFARQVKHEFPDMIVILRNWPDDNLYSKLSPKSWLEQHESQASGGLYLYTCNESGLSQDNINWHLELMDLAVQRGIHLVLLNPATGTWDTSEINRLKPLLIKASQHRDLFVIGLHSYAGGAVTSGIAGGNPDNAGVAPGQPGGRNLIPVKNWPSPVTDTTFHLGRHHWIIRACMDLGLANAMPRFGLTETGFDYLGDIGQWLNSLDHSGFTSVNGWQTLRSQWSDWWKINADKAYIMQMQYAAENLLNGLEFALIFCYGDDGSWHNYDVSRSGIPTLLEGLNTTPAPIPTPIPQFPDFPADFDNRAVPGEFFVSVDHLLIREKPTQLSALVGKISAGQQLLVYIPATALKPLEIYSDTINGLLGTWLPVEFESYRGWVFGAYLKVIEPAPTNSHSVTLKIKGLTAQQARDIADHLEISIE